MNPTIIILFASLAAVMAVWGAYSIFSDLFLRDRTRVSARVDAEFRNRQRERAQRSMLFKDLGQANIESAEDFAKPPSWRERLDLVIEQSGLEITQRRLLMIMAGVGGFTSVLVFLLPLNPLIVLLIGPAAAFLPLGYVLYKRKQRMARLLAQLADAFDLMSRCIRAGQTMSQSLQAVVDGFDAPIASEFSMCFEQMNLGLPPEIAMRDLARRTGLLEIKVFVLAMLIQTQTGGNLAEMLEKMGGIVRDRFRIKSKIAALTAEGRLQALVLLALPPVLFLIFFAVNPAYAGLLLASPGLLAGMVILELLGALWIRSIVNFDY
jgi:tight adherence protein B